MKVATTPNTPLAAPTRPLRWTMGAPVETATRRLGGALIAAALVAAGAPIQGGAAEPAAEPAFAVVSPLGESTVEMGAMAPRLDTLEGKTVCLVWNYAFKADVTLPAIGEALKQLYPNLTIIPHHAMPLAPLPDTPGTSGAESEALKAALLANGCDALIVGNGG